MSDWKKARCGKLHNYPNYQVPIIIFPSQFLYDTSKGTSCGGSKFRFSPFLWATKALRVSRGIALLFLGPWLSRWGWGTQPHAPAASTPGKNSIPIVQETGWAPGPVWTGGKLSSPPRFFLFFLIFAFILQMFVSYYNRSDIDKPEIRKM